MTNVVSASVVFVSAAAVVAFVVIVRPSVLLILAPGPRPPLPLPPLPPVAVSAPRATGPLPAAAPLAPLRLLLPPPLPAPRATPPPPLLTPGAPSPLRPAPRPGARTVLAAAGPLLLRPVRAGLGSISARDGSSH